MTQDSPAFAAAVRVARRALAERIAARTSEERTLTDTSAATASKAIVPTQLPPVLPAK
jgi:hypothetical protein